MQQRKLTFFEKTKDILFNIRYKMISFFEEFDLKSLLKPGDTIHFLGREYRVTEINLQNVTNEVYMAFKQTAWVTYRSGFPAIFKEESIQNSFVSDTGWGCMIRVGQMAFAQILKEHLRLENNEEQMITQVIELFNDCDAAKPFSILNITKVARYTYGMDPGEWYNPSQISYILAKLHFQYLEAQNKLTFIVFNSGNLFYEEIYFKMIGRQNAKECSCACKLGTAFCYSCFPVQKAVGVICLARIGLDCPETKYLNVLSLIMKLKAFRGLIGGKPKKALYFLGTYNEDFMYLDPHYVHHAEKNMENIKGSYFCASFRKIQRAQIDSSIGLVFYLRNFNEFKEFMRGMQKVKENNVDEFFLFSNERTPSFMGKGSFEIKTIEQPERYTRIGDIL